MDQNIEKLYETIIKYSWNSSIDDYFTFIIKNSKYLVTNKKEQAILIDKTIKKILANLKQNINLSVYDNLIINMGPYANQDGYDFAIGLIKTYYQNEFVINGCEYRAFDIIINIYNEYKTADTLPMLETFHYILATLFRIHYILYVKKAF